MPEITENSVVPFRRGPNKGRRIRDVDDRTLAWMVETYTDTDFHLYAIVAAKVIEGRKAGAAQFAAEESLEAQADEILRRAGCGGLAGSRGRRGGR